MGVYKLAKKKGSFKIEEFTAFSFGALRSGTRFYTNEEGYGSSYKKEYPDPKKEKTDDRNTRRLGGRGGRCHFSDEDVVYVALSEQKRVKREMAKEALLRVNSKKTGPKAH